MARRTDLTSELIERVVELYKRGYTQLEIYTQLGIAERTWYSWLERGRAGREPYVQLYRGLEQARAERRVNLVKIIESHAQKHWVAAAWILEREYPERYAKPDARVLREQGEDEIVDDL